MPEKVEIILGKDGSIKVEAFGFKGSSCEEATAFLKNLFGDADNVIHKASFWEQKEQIFDGLPAGRCG